jgi:hypothetical protein
MTRQGYVVARGLHLRNRSVETVGAPGYEDSGSPSVAEGVQPAAANPTVVEQPRPYGTERGVATGNGALSAGLGFLGLLAVLIGAWGGIVPYLGPTFGYHSTAAGGWYWDWQHSLLYLIPGAVTVLMGLWMWGLAARTRIGAGRFGSLLAAIVLLAAGAWFVLGPVVWAIFYSTAVFEPASATNNFLNQLGYNLGPGLIIAALGGMTLAHSATRRRVRL